VPVGGFGGMAGSRALRKAVRRCLIGYGQTRTSGAAASWTLTDGARYTTGYRAEEFAASYEAPTEAGHQVVVATPDGAVPNVNMMSLRACALRWRAMPSSHSTWRESSAPRRRCGGRSSCRTPAWGLRRRLLPRRPRPDRGPGAQRRRGPAADRGPRLGRTARRRPPRPGREAGHEDARRFALRRLGPVVKFPSSARRAGPAASGACSRRAGHRPSYWTYLDLCLVR
jgi:hypothetical protein